MINKKIYKVEWEDKALKQLSKLDKSLAKKLYDQTNKDLAEDPIENGKRLVGDWKGFWAYRYRRSYRIIYELYFK